MTSAINSALSTANIPSGSCTVTLSPSDVSTASTIVRQPAITAPSSRTTGWPPTTIATSVQRLEQLFWMHGVEAKAVNCPPIDCITREADEVAGEVDDDRSETDVAGGRQGQSAGREPARK